MLIFLILIFSNIFAEYRVYQFYVRSKIQNIAPNEFHLVTSVLDPKSYLAYHGGTSSIEVNLLRSWQCFGNTSQNELCQGLPINTFNEKEAK